MKLQQSRKWRPHHFRLEVPLARSHYAVWFRDTKHLAKNLPLILIMGENLVPLASSDLRLAFVE